MDGRSSPVHDFFSSSYFLGGVRIDVTSDDSALLTEISTTLGSPVDISQPAAIVLGATLRSGSAESDEAHLHLETPDREALSADDLILGLESPGFPFRRCESDAGWDAFAFQDDARPVFSFHDGETVVWKRDRWRAAVGFLLLHRIYRLRRDAIFFHASSVSINGKGVLFIGTKGAGKSTTALALAARGIPLLGDEIACYKPATGMLEPFLRPVGIKMGPRAARVDAALKQAGVNVAEIVRIDIARLFDVTPASPVPLRAIVFLEPFAAEPRLTRSEGRPDEIASLQPVVSSLVNAPRARRVFEMARMLSSSSVYHLAPGQPDETAELIARELGGA